MTDKLLTEVEAAEILGVKVATIKTWRGNSTGPVYYKIGGAVRYKKSDLDSFLEASRVEPTN